jgi:hypothetical protein
MHFAQPQFAVRKSLQVSRTISSGAMLDWGVRKMKAIIQLRVAARALSITSVHLFLIFFLCLALPALVAAQGDPLSPTYLPAMDTNSAHYPSNIWITDTMQKIKQTPVATPGAAHWGTFYGTQNEFVDFQVHVAANSGSISNLSVTVSNFVQAAPNSSTISCATGIGEFCIVYRESYIHVTTAINTASNTFYGAAGYYPDPLIPAVDPYRGQTTNAFPFTVASGNNQSIWVDVHIPPTAPPGYYLGSVTVKSGSTTLATLPVTIGVWQWPSAHGGKMPSTSSLQSWSQMNYAADVKFPCGGSYAGCASYPGAGGSSESGLKLGYVDLSVIGLDHRFSVPNYMYPGFSTSFTDLESFYGPLFNGTTTRGTQTLLQGAKITSVSYTSSGYAYTSNWATEFQSKGWTPLLESYPIDEPGTNCSNWTNGKNVASGNLHTASPKIPWLVTGNIGDATACSAISGTTAADILVPIIQDMDTNTYFASANTPTGYHRSEYNTWLTGNCCGAGSPPRQVWSYQSCESAACGGTSVNVTYPNYGIDGKPTANRAMEWMTYRNDQSGELYYEFTQCWDNCSSDPWTNQVYSGMNGDGTLVYPGDNAHIGVSQFVFLPSVRLKHLRDGMQDYEYLQVLANAGQSAFAQQQIQSWITNSYTFEMTGSGLTAARQALGAKLHQQTYSTSLLPPPTLNGTLQ